MRELAVGCKAVWESRGEIRDISEEREIVAWAREAVVSVENIPKGTKILQNMVTVKRPSPKKGAVPAKDLESVIGKIALKDISSD